MSSRLAAVLWLAMNLLILSACYSYPSGAMPILESAKPLRRWQGPLLVRSNASHFCPSWERGFCQGFARQMNRNLEYRVSKALDEAGLLRAREGAPARCELILEERELPSSLPVMLARIPGPLTFWIIPEYFRDIFSLQATVTQGERVTFQRGYQDIAHRWMGWAFALYVPKGLDGTDTVLINLVRTAIRDVADSVAPECDMPSYDSGEAFGFRVGASTSETLSAVIEQQSRGFVRALQITEAEHTSAGRYSGNPAHPEDLARLAASHEWQLGLTGCNCRLLLRFENDRLSQVVYQVYGPIE